MDRPETWHHGLVARDWAEFAHYVGAEGAYFQRLIERSGEPALDLGCGTGRLLLPFLRAGMDIDGCDYSQDMLALCEAQASAEGLSPRLYRQALHELDLPRRYRTIFMCGVIGLGGERLATAEGLRRCYEHLRPGGTLAFDLAARWNDPPPYLAWLPEGRQGLPDPWPESGERQRLADGSELEMVVRTFAVDPLEEVQTRELRARLWRDGELVKEEVHTQRYDQYGKNELMGVLKAAGFSDIQLFGDYQDEPATADHHTILFVARK